jgi:Mg-chelatase subunit ChlD
MSLRRLALVVGLVAGSVAPASGEPPEGRSGIELVEREGATAPEHWSAIDKATGKVAAKVHSTWGFAAVPPGEYSIVIRPRGSEAVVVPWGEVRVEEGKATRVEVTSGVETVGRGDEEALEHWDVLDKATGRPVAHVWRHWGFTPVPPGSYALRIKPTGNQAIEIPWGEVTVAKGEAARVAVDTGIELAGRPDDEALEDWEVLDKATGNVVAHTWRRWGFTPLPAGAYALRIRPAGSGAIEIAWGDVDVPEGGVASVRIDSGIEIPGRPGRDPPENWLVHDSRSRAAVARVYQRWGFTPLPPGTYDVLSPPQRWSAVEVVPGQVVSLAEEDPAVRWRKVSGAGRKSERERDPAAWKRLEEEVEQAIRRAAAFLKANGHIERMDPMEDDGKPTIGILALAHAGELERDPALARRARDYLTRRALNDTYGTYVTSVTAMALTDMGAARNRARIFDCATWLVENQGWGSEERRVWGYGDAVPGFDAKPPRDPAARRGEPRPRDVSRAGLVAKPRSSWDNSNAQFGVLGLHSAARARVGIPRESWERVESHFRDTQTPDGGWGYSRGGPTGSMTCAGVASLVIARHHLGQAQPAVDPAILDGLDWLASKFTVEENPGQGRSFHHYYLYGLERVGVLAGTEFIGEHEWYPEGARHLVRTQEADGSWGNDPFVDTCYAILFLRRATLPLETEAPALVSVTRDEAAVRRDMPAVELILDCSGSMKEAVDGRPKMDVAREVITDVLAALPAEMQVGLRLYGHKQPPQKTDTELVVPIGPLDEGRRRTIQGWIDRARPVGWTPMVHSLLQARSDFSTEGNGTRTVVLVSDGEETGGGKVSDVEAVYARSGIDVVIHVVGFDVEAIPLAQQQMKEIARVGKGRYFAAKSASDLAGALREAMPAPGVEVLDATGKVVARVPFNGDPAELAPGAYRVRVPGSSSGPLDLSLAEGEEVALRMDEAGKIQRE